MSIDVRELFTSFKKLPEIRELQKLIETYDMRYFPQHVLLSVQVLYTTNQQTSVFRDIKDPLDTKQKIFKNRLNS